MLPHKSIESTLVLSRRIAGMIGFDFYDENYQLTLKSYIVIFDAITYILMTLHNVYTFRNDLTRVCFCLITWTFGFMVRSLTVSHELLFFTFIDWTSSK